MFGGRSAMYWRIFVFSWSYLNILPVLVRNLKITPSSMRSVILMKRYRLLGLCWRSFLSIEYIAQSDVAPTPLISDNLLQHAIKCLSEFDVARFAFFNFSKITYAYRIVATITALDWNPQGHRGRGREVDPKTTWKITVVDKVGESFQIDFPIQNTNPRHLHQNLDPCLRNFSFFKSKACACNNSLKDANYL